MLALKKRVCVTHSAWARELDKGTFYHVSLNMYMKFMQARLEICTNAVFEICIPVMLYFDRSFSCIYKRSSY